MKAMGALAWLHRQMADLITVFLLPALAGLMPAKVCTALCWLAAGQAWLFPSTYASARRSAECALARAETLPREWAWTTLIEAAETWRLIFGLSPRLDVEGEWPTQPGFVAASLHYGVGTSVLWHLRESGLAPRFVYRPVASTELPGRPVLQAWYKLRTRLIERLCPTGGIRTGGARQTIAEALKQRDGTVVVLFDAPSADGRLQLSIGRARLRLRTGGLRLIESANNPVAFFHVHVDRLSGRCRLRIRMLSRTRPLAPQLTKQIKTVISADPGQWLLWHGVEGLLLPGPGTTSAPGSG